MLHWECDEVVDVDTGLMINTLPVRRAAARMVTPATSCLAINWAYFLGPHYVQSAISRHSTVTTACKYFVIPWHDLPIYNVTKTKITFYQYMTFATIFGRVTDISFVTLQPGFSLNNVVRCLFVINCLDCLWPRMVIWFTKPLGSIQ